MSFVMRKPVDAICKQQGGDQPAHPCSLISDYIVRCLDSIIPLLAVAEISKTQLASVTEQTGLYITLLKSFPMLEIKEIPL